MIFAGTPEPAVASLLTLLDSDHEVVAVLTRPDAPAGRGRKLRPSPVGKIALEREIPVLRPTSIKDPQFLAGLRELEPDACPVVAYGALIPQAALDIPKHGWINLHFSLLPAWRGAAPVQHAIWHGDEITGASTFRLEAGLDTGPVFGVVTNRIAPNETTGSLLVELSAAGAQLLVRTLDGIATGDLVAVPQPGEGVSLAPKIIVADARIDWSATELAIDRMVRACTPAPGAWTTFGDQRIKLGPVLRTTAFENRPDPGQLQVTENRVVVGTGTYPVVLTTVQAQGRREMSASDWARGRRLESGVYFS